MDSSYTNFWIINSAKKSVVRKFAKACLIYLEKNPNEVSINQYNDIVNKMARIELNRARKRYETTFAQYVMESSHL